MAAHVIVIGAGVIGLQTSLTLLEAGYTVTLLAQHFPGDQSIEYTSPWAGAVWRTHATAEQTEQCAWDLESYRAWMKLLADEPESAAAMGLQRRPMRIYFLGSEVDIAASSLWFAPHVDNFSVLSGLDLPANVKSGIVHDSIALNPPKYLEYLFQLVRKRNAKIVRAELPTSDGLAAAIRKALHLASDVQEKGKKPVIVNCTGIGARLLCSDENVYPIRGQTLLVRVSPAPPAESVHITMHPATSANPADQGVTYIVPRPGSDTFVLGGTKKDGDWSAVPDEEISKGIVERCRSAWDYLAKEDVSIEILSTQVGLRPGRKGGARVDKESMVVGETRIQVVHQYGHSGAGYQNSIGSAKKVLELVREAFDSA